MFRCFFHFFLKKKTNPFCKVVHDINPFVKFPKKQHLSVNTNLPEVVLEISTYQKWEHKVTTDWFCNFLGNQHRPLMNTENDYRLVLIFSWKSALTPPKNLQFGFQSVKKTWTNLFQKPSETKVTTDWFCNFLENQHWTPKMTTNWFCVFLANQNLAPWAHQIATNWFFSFLGNQHQATNKVYN